MKRNRTRVNYPAKLVVDQALNESTGKMEPVEISTGPYRKDICGSTQQEVNAYLAHLVERYRIEKNKIILSEKLPKKQEEHEVQSKN